MTERLKILMEDWVMDALVPITYSDELVALPALNLRDPDPTIPMQTSGTDLTIEFDVSSLPQPWGEIGLFIGNHNLTPTVEIHFQADDTFAGAPAIDVTLSLASFVDDTNYLSTSQLFNKLYLRLIDGATTTFSYDKIRITIADPDNADGYLRIGILSVGPVGSENNFARNFTINTTISDATEDASTGDSYMRPAKPREAVDFTFNYVGMDMLARLRRWIENGGYQKERWIALSPNGSEQATLTYYGRIESFSAIKEILKDSTRGLYSVDIRIDDLCPAPKNFDQLSITTHSDFVKLPNRTDVFLALIMPGEIVADTWTLDTDNTYYISYPAATETFQVVQIYVDGVKISRAASLAGAKSTPGRWYFDIETAKRPYLHLSDGSDPTDHTVELRVLLPFCSEIPVEQKWNIMDITIDGTTISNVCFVRRLSSSGLQSISSELESAYFGIAVPNATGVQVANDKQRYTDVHGRHDKFVDRFIWKQRETQIYHGGYPLTFSQYLYLDSFTMVTVECSDEIFNIGFDSAAVLQKKVPQDVFENDSAFRLDYKPWFRGNIEDMPTFKQTKWRFAYCGHIVDDLVSVWKGDHDQIDAGDYTSDTDVRESALEFDEDKAPSNDDSDSIVVHAKYMVDIDGTGGETSQLAGAFLRSMLNTLGDQPLAVLPSTSFQTLDTDYAITVRAYVSGGDNGQTTLQNLLLKAARSFFCWIRKAQGEWEIYRFDPNNLRASSATIYEDEIISCSKEIEQEAIVRRVRMAYYTDLALKTSKFVTGNHPTAETLYPTTEILEIAESFLTEAEDAESVRDLYLTVKGTEQKIIRMRATGEIFLANPGDVVTVNRSKAFDVTGAWASRDFIVRSITKYCADRPGFCDVVLVEPAAPLLSNADVLFAGHNTWQEVTTVADGAVSEISRVRNHPGGGLLIWVMYNMGSTPCLPDVVEWNGVDVTANLVEDSSAVDSNIRIAVYFVAAATAGSHTAYAHFPNTVDCVTINIDSLTNGATIGDTAVVYQASGKAIQATVTSATGDMVVSGTICEKAPPTSEHNLGAGQISHCAQRMSYNGSFTNVGSSTAHGSHKDGGASSTTMKHSEDVNTSKKVLIVVVVQS